MAGSSTERLFTIAAVGATILAAFAVLWRLTLPSLPGPDVELLEPNTVEAFWSGQHDLDRPDDAVRIMHFYSFGCRISEMSTAYLSELSEHSHIPVEIVHRHGPPITHDAWPSSITVGCARVQVPAQSVIEDLFELRSTIGRIGGTDPVSALNVPDRDALVRCMHEGVGDSVALADSLAWHELGLRAIPTILIGDRLIHGFPGESVVDSILLDVWHDSP